MLHNLFEDLLIHGEGGDGGAGAAPGAAPGPEAAGVTTPDAGENKPQEKARPRKYGRPERLPYEYGIQGPERDSAPAQTAQASAKRPFEEIEKDYHDEIGQKIEKAVTGRIKNLKDSEAELTTTKAALDERDALLAQLAAAQFNIQPGADGKADIAAIKKAAGKSRVEEYAMENGVSEEFAQERIDMEDKLREQDRQLREFQAAEQKRQQDAEQYAQFQQHRQQAEAFRQKMNWPEFDLVKEMEKSPTFTHLLSCGVGVENAYFSAHHDELMAAQAKAASMQATRALSASIQAGQSRPVEGGLGRSPAANPQRVASPKNLTKDMRRDLRKRVNAGEEIYW